jgi:hypothetical protein
MVGLLEQRRCFYWIQTILIEMSSMTCSLNIHRICSPGVATTLHDLLSAFLIREPLARTIMSPASVKKNLQVGIIISVRYNSLLTIFGIMQGRPSYITPRIIYHIKYYNSVLT